VEKIQGKIREKTREKIWEKSGNKNQETIRKQKSGKQIQEKNTGKNLGHNRLPG